MRISAVVVSICMTISTVDSTPIRTERGESQDSRVTRSVRRRLRPLYVAGFFLGINFWAPVEKLFLSRIGFTTATIGLLAATYAVVVPFLEIPSGILADRWSRRGILMIADLALAASALVGGLSTSVPTYLAAALLLGCYFALQSGTADSIIYDVLIEETGRSDGFERELGRLRLLESIALVSSALVGGIVAALMTPRITYFLTVPFALVAMVVLSRLAEPNLHRSDESPPLRCQIQTTYKTIAMRGPLRPIIVAMVLCALLLQALVEFGPLWMVALAAPAFLYGPQWAGLMSAMGLGGLLGGRLSLSRRVNKVAMAAVMVASSLVLTTSHNAMAVIAAQVVLALLVVAISTVLTRQFHDAVPSAIRAGVSSGVGTLTWVAFVPFALGFGLVSRHVGVLSAGWLIVAIALASGVSLFRLNPCRSGRATAVDAGWTQPQGPLSGLARAGS
jgi:predicted MFS family arabinose efflux permease